ncbi:MAG TPA: FIST N-terminal domain-containing protein, partial [Solirubrobacteraceae bacterium]|nr:FIST N-terminal domain-containing protein [Solirubrobacteraceae bacterium]
AAGSVPVAGMTGASVLGPGGPSDEGCVALALGDRTSAGLGVARQASDDLRAAARRAAAQALIGLDGRHASLLVLLLDSGSGDQGEAVAGAYEAAGPRVPLAGGAAGGREPLQFCGGAVLHDAVVAVALHTEAPVGMGIAHGCRPRPGPAIVTQVDGRVVRRLDGRPAECVYLERLGAQGRELGDAQFERLAAVHPLGQLELRGDVRLRHVLGRTRDRGLLCATRLPRNAPIQFSDQTPASIAASARAAVQQATTGLEGRRAGAALVFDCGGRREALGGSAPALRAEARALDAAFGPDGAPPMIGLYTRGEIGRLRGARGDRNHAVVVAALA